LIKIRTDFSGINLKEYLQTKMGSRYSSSLYEWLLTTDIFVAPASTKYHNNFEGGLLSHMFLVVELAEHLASIVETPPDPISLFITSFFHDLCKLNVYFIENAWRKDSKGKWESYETYVFRESVPLGHGEKSAYLLSQHINLSPEEYAAIMFHMGAYEVGNTLDYARSSSFKQAQSQYPLVKLVSHADHLTNLFEKTVTYK